VKEKALIVLFFFTVLSSTWGQIVNDTIKDDFAKNYKFNSKQLIVPAILIGYGVWATDNDQLEFFNNEIKEEVGEHIDDKISIDDFSQHTPVATIFALDFFGIKGKNTLKDKAIITATSFLIMGISVSGIKKVSQVERPDGSSFSSFPSGHTATAFMGAELLHREYKDVSIWYGISGYLIASGTGVFRMLNNRHWFSDVVAGAGIGILSAKAGYWLFPAIKKIVSKSALPNETVFLPFYDGKTVGFGLVSQF
jgi:hypothetical protein